jgi:hypothetical protein
MRIRKERIPPKSPQDKQDKVLDLTGLKPLKRKNTVRSGLGDYSTAGSPTNNDVMMREQD